jgi:uncharacterized repeat protein (TIGR01451 family)
MTTDVALRLGYQTDLEVNLGVYSGDVTPSPEVRPSMLVDPAYVRPGETVTYQISVVNTSETPGAGHTMAGVLITDLLPPSLTPVGAAVSLGATEWWGNLLTADIGELAPGQAVTITVTARARPDLPLGALLNNRATLIYRDHVAVQTELVSVQVATPPAQEGAEPPPAYLPVTGGERPGATR